MNEDILNLEQAMALFGVGERTMIKLLREERLPARKIGREWRFSRQALMDWLATGCSADYLQGQDQFRYYADEELPLSGAYQRIEEAISALRQAEGRIGAVLPEAGPGAILPDSATLRVSFKRQRDVEKLSFKIYWLGPSEDSRSRGMIRECDIED